MENSLITLIADAVEPLIPTSIRDESIGDIVELHHSMKKRQTALLLRLVVTVYRFLSLLRGALHIHVLEFFKTQRGIKWLERYGLNNGSKLLLILMAVSLSL